MAFRSNGPITLSLPPFRGITRRIILIALVGFVAETVFGIISYPPTAFITNLLLLHPDQAVHKQIWQFVTYPFLGMPLLSLLFALLSVWFFGATLEDERGPRWFAEFFLTVTISGGLVATLLAYASAGHVPGLNPDDSIRAAGLWPFSLALLVAFGRLHAEEVIRFNLIFKLKAKYLAALYVAFYLVLTVFSGDRFGGLVALMNALAGYCFVRFVPRRGVRAGLSERWFGLRNAWYRAKRRRAAKKFTVYMRKQGKDVSLDPDGRYIDPNGTPRDPNDRNWMN
jgi:membrane associated rhomboid family serine protease